VQRPKGRGIKPEDINLARLKNIPYNGGNLLEEQGYNLQSNKKSLADTNNPDRNDQFEYISKKVADFIKQGQPVISVDAKKKEQLGNFKNNGKTYRKNAGGTPARVSKANRQT